jgi:DNA-damage-inducible protein J
MATSIISIRMDDQLKKSMEKTCSELGMTMTTAFTIFAKKMTREQRIPFEVSIDPFFSEENMEHLRKSIANLENGSGTEHEIFDE